MKRKSIISFMIFLSVLVTTLYFLQLLFMPKYVSDIPEGSLVGEYYQEEGIGRHSVIFIGDCEVYENISPITLWEEYGITSYIRGSSQQLIWQSYYLLEETLKYEIPKVVVFNVLSMKYNEPQKEEYNRMTLDEMKFSLSKVNSIKASMVEGESMVDYIFPLLRYHDRWADLKKEDFKYIINKKKMFHNGYLMISKVKPVRNIRKGKRLSNYTFGENAYFYLNKIVQLCKENGVKLFLIKSPSLYPYWYEEWDEQITRFAKKNDVLYINYLKHIEEIGLDFSKDTYDAGLHLNVFGAEKFSKYIGGRLKKEYDLKDHRKDKKLFSLWKEKVDFYYKMKKEQMDEIKDKE